MRTVTATKVLVVGGGGREHALCWRLKSDDPRIELLAAPGNPGIAELATIVPVDAGDVAALADLAARERVDVTVVGPEAPLALGIVDHFRARGLPIFGPTRAAAEIETSKAFAKALLLSAGIPTARAEMHTTPEGARRAVRAIGGERGAVVIKASGLAAGKGVIVCQSLEEADRAVDFMLGGGMGSAGAEILVEEFMEGEELSLFVLTDGERAIPLVAAQDHKRLLAGDRGPNTGGMGAYAPVSIAHPGAPASAALLQEVMRTIIAPTLAAMRARGRPFTGLLYAGLMLTRDGPRVVEFNCRFGDPETQAVLPVMALRPTLLELITRIARGEPLPDDHALELRGCAVTTVVAAEGYPERPRTGDVVHLPRVDDVGVLIFHAGTRRLESGELASAGGRVLAVTAVAPTFEEAQRLSRRYAEEVEFPGRQLRSDIGWRELRRRSGSGETAAGAADAGTT